MSSLPDRKRPGLLRPSRVLVASAARLAAAATWRVAHPRLRESYVEQPKPQAVPRLYYRTHDGWQIPIKVLPVLPGKTGEPVLLAAGLGFDSGLFRYGRDGGFAGLLQAAGFQVYLLGHRGSPEAIAPQTGPLEVSFDHIVERDLEPAVERVLGHSGAQRLLWFGDALGGQLGTCGCLWGAPRANCSASGHGCSRLFCWRTDLRA